MKSRFLAIALAVALAAGPMCAQTTKPVSAAGAAKIQQQIDKMQRALDAIPDSDQNWKGLKPVIAGFLGNARAALASSDTYLALAQLGKAYAPFQAMQYSEKTDAAVKDMPAFEAQWKRVSLDIASFDSAARNRAWDNLPAVVRALSESSAGKIEALLNASRAYAKVTSTQSGLYYLGETKAEADFAELCYSINVARRGTPFPLRSYSPELKALQTRLNAAFQPPRSIQKHPQFIRLNATVKLANELDAAGLHAGALYQYLDALQQLSTLEAPETDAAQQERIPSAITSLQEQLAASGRDDSIAELFLQTARLLSAPRDGKVPQASDWTSANVIVTEVLPAYFAAAKAAPAEAPSQKRSTTITLVRWPYT